jgi:hypothetical protein
MKCNECVHMGEAFRAAHDEAVALRTQLVSVHAEATTLRGELAELTALLRESFLALGIVDRHRELLARVDAALAGGGEKKRGCAAPGCSLPMMPGQILCESHFLGRDTKPIASEQFWASAEAAAARTEDWPQWKKDGSAMAPKPVAGADGRCCPSWGADIEGVCRYHSARITKEPR